MAISKIGKGAVDLGTPCVNVHNANAQSLSATTFTDVVLDTETIDTQGNFASNAFTVPDVGLYFIIATCEVNCDDTDELVRVTTRLTKKPSGGSHAAVAGTEQNFFKDHDANESFTRAALTTTFAYTSAVNDEWKVQVFANAGGGSLTVQAEGASFIAFKIH
tara:strand:- start:31 stop:516 length:486 start_codon:yes stop_codon:yes gene_type:complete